MSQVIDKSVKNCTTKEAARLLQVTPRTVQLWAESGIIKAKKTAGGHRRFSLVDIEALQAKLEAETGTRSESRNLRILVIEDEPDLIMLYKMAIEGWNLPLTIQTAADGYEGLVLIGAWNPDVVITDIQMPNIDGVHMLNTISKMKSFTNMVIIAVSALSKSDIEQRGGLPEGIPLFSKPIPFDEIERIVKQQCETKLNR